MIEQNIIDSAVRDINSILYRGSYMGLELQSTQTPNIYKIVFIFASNAHRFSGVLIDYTNTKFEDCIKKICTHYNINYIIKQKEHEYTLEMF